MTLSENDLLFTFIERAPHALPVRVFRRPIINERAARGHWLKSGQAGQADAYAIARGTPALHVELETKAARGVMRDAQRAWRAFCREWGIPHLVLRAAPKEDPNATVARWIAELGEVIRAA